MFSVHSPEHKVMRTVLSLREENKIKTRQTNYHHHRSPARSCIVFRFSFSFLSDASFCKIIISLLCSLSLISFVPDNVEIIGSDGISKDVHTSAFSERAAILQTNVIKSFHFIPRSKILTILR